MQGKPLDQDYAGMSSNCGKSKPHLFPLMDVREGTCVDDGAGGERGGKQQPFLPALQGPPSSPSPAGSWNGTQGVKGANYPMAYSLVPLLVVSW